ncbi:hypothetical protein J3D55_002771 [Chryseobacterium ginsenosidimutans]|nr:hypothetical protein [Chryseobacterium ginsenosidimutans]
MFLTNIIQNLGYLYKKLKAFIQFNEIFILG